MRAALPIVPERVRKIPGSFSWIDRVEDGLKLRDLADRLTNLTEKTDG